MWFKYRGGSTVEMVWLRPWRFSVSQVATRLLTASEVAAILGVPKTWVYEQSRAGRIPTVALGRYRRFRPEAIDRWVAELEHRDDRPTA